MGLLDFLLASKPGATKQLNVAQAAIGLFVPEIDAAENAIQPLTPEPDRAPGGAFDQALNQGGQDDVLQDTLQQFQFIVIDVTKAGPVPGFFPADVDGNTLAIIPRAMVDELGTVIESATDAVIYCKVNQQRNLMLPLSYAQQAGGPAVNNLGSIQGNIRRLWLYVAQPTQDASRNFVVLALMKDVAFTQPGGAGSFTTASVSTGSGTESTVQGGGVSGPAPAPAPSGGGVSGSGGTGGGTLGSGGGGGGSTKTGGGF